MRTIHVEPLTIESFLPFGFYANLIDPQAEKIGDTPIEFYRDMVQLDLGRAGAASFSVCRVEPRHYVIDVSEFHTATGEAILPLDNDVLVHVGPATPINGAPPLDKFRVFRVPQGTLVVLRPGVWHHAPIALGDKPANVLIVLPERTYANDCTVVKLDADEQLVVTL
ncbi:MAG: ureidoglycolate lyase [Anaerolineae bacterium]|nr:ureidoglycolate lyase [Thermoflexales bacterium]MDW8408234.1 ureidoglycolate lyase [Anaerolineae bacterium]